jgi:hypothetical protein
MIAMAIIYAFVIWVNHCKLSAISFLKTIQANTYLLAYPSHHEKHQAELQLSQISTQQQLLRIIKKNIESTPK